MSHLHNLQSEVGGFETEAAASDRGHTGWTLRWLQRLLAGTPIRVVLWDGRSFNGSSVPPVAEIEIKDRGALLGLFWNPQLSFGESFTAGRIEVNGDLTRCLEAVYQALARWKPSVLWPSVPWLRGNTLPVSRRNVHHHYDIGSDFYQLWLDKELVYTCAYFPSPSVTLEAAQIAKMDHVCRKLRLQPGERVVEAGCGWGAFALHMARCYGVEVKAFNLSHDQIQYARKRASEEGLADRVEFVEDDYRNITGRFDVFVSVGMLEHVGLQHYRALGEIMCRSLQGQCGRGLLHFIGRTRRAQLNPWIRKYIFPGGYAPTLAEVLEHVLAPWDFSLLDVENLRLHYAKTLEQWLARFEEAADRVRVMFGEPFVRTWRLYLAGSKAAFSTGSLQLFQVLFAPGYANAIPWTREDMYREATRAGELS